MWLKNESQYANQRQQNCAEEQKVLNDSLKNKSDKVHAGNTCNTHPA